MRGGKQHTLVELTEPGSEEHTEHGMHWTSTWKYECSTCGRPFQVRSTAPSCAIDMILEIEGVAQQASSLVNGQLHDAIDQLVKQGLHWKKDLRERFIPEWEHWRKWRETSRRRDNSAVPAVSEPVLSAHTQWTAEQQAAVSEVKAACGEHWEQCLAEFAGAEGGELVGRCMAIYDAVGTVTAGFALAFKLGYDRHIFAEYVREGKTLRKAREPTAQCPKCLREHPDPDGRGVQQCGCGYDVDAPTAPGGMTHPFPAIQVGDIVHVPQGTGTVQDVLADGRIRVLGTLHPRHNVTLAYSAEDRERYGKSLGVTCPTCGAEPGTLCRPQNSPVTEPRKFPHTPRTTLASKSSQTVPAQASAPEIPTRTIARGTRRRREPPKDPIPRANVQAAASSARVATPRSARQRTRAAKASTAVVLSREPIVERCPLCLRNPLSGLQIICRTCARLDPQPVKTTRSRSKRR